MMNCNVIQDLLPLYVDGCCSAESAKAVEEHLEQCTACRAVYDDMKAPSDEAPVPEAPRKLSRLNDWKASVLQSVLLFVSFALITVGVALEARTPVGLMNGFWAMSLVIPSTGFLLSLANWYFVRIYPSRRMFSTCSCLITLAITACTYIWSLFHYEIDLFTGLSLSQLAEGVFGLLFFYGIGVVLTVVFGVLSKTLSGQYAAMLGKE